MSGKRTSDFANLPPIIGAEYRKRLLAHSEARGLSKPWRRGNVWTFKAPKSGKRAIVDFEPKNPGTYLRYAKGVLTGASSAPLKQRGRWKPLRLRNPSTNDQTDWLHVENPAGDVDPLNAMLGLTGKWMIFCHRDNVDPQWGIIKKAVRVDQSLCSAKVSTTVNYQNPGQHVICVYTRNWQDKDDVFATREVLRQLGFASLLYYKSDKMTMMGVSGSLYRG